MGNSEKIRLNEYVEKLLEERKKEVIREDIINEFNKQKGEGLTSPTTSTSTEQARILMDYINRSNLLKITNADESRRKALMLKQFLKSKRNQQVEVYSKCGTKSCYTEGKVSSVGRNFVMLTNLKDRIWIPYDAIESANVPYGIPNYSNSHQHYIYDNDLRNKLVQNFGETVAKRDVLKKQFYEETLETNLQSWKDTWVEVFKNDDTKKIGRIICSKDGIVTLSFFKKTEKISLKDMHYIETVRFFSVLLRFLKIKEN